MKPGILLIAFSFVSGPALFAAKPKHPAVPNGNVAGPTISYSSPQTYTVGTAIKSLTPTSSGVGAFGYGSPAGIGSGFSLPTGLALDQFGNLYIADAGNNEVKEIAAGGGGPSGNRLGL